ncbi:hypothetical protein BV25DRAFT_451171 [Artomyces pyxidatus]|uniref:Uncharacterized protein n=1 Tax=Artomyces pyxidatus TaxID=48021 RepID=A0ACB8T2S6_9AGAM|nr:hypothetical protein BV25DRAFT_451171 [Artomyces pyxidatus]
MTLTLNHMEDAAAPSSPASTRRSPSQSPPMATIDIAPTPHGAPPSPGHPETSRDGGAGEEQDTHTSALAMQQRGADAQPAVRILGVNYDPQAGDGEGGVDRGADSPRSPQRTDLHPLRLDIQPPSPLPWEAMEPPSTHGHGHATSDWHSSQPDSFHKKSAPRRTIPVSSYYFGPPPADSAYGTAPMGQIGVHHPREIVRVERDYTGGEVVQFAPTYPLEFEGRITPTQFLESINAMNEILISAHSLRRSFFDNCLDILTLRIYKLVLSSHYEREMRRLQRLLDELNGGLYNPVGLHILWPGKVGFLFLEIEYY